MSAAVPARFDRSHARGRTPVLLRHEPGARAARTVRVGDGRVAEPTRPSGRPAAPRRKAAR